MRGLHGVTLMVTVATALAACSAGSRTTPEATAGVPPSVAGSTPRPTEVPGPPVASIVAAAARPAPGQLGTFTWDGLGSEAPWIVPERPVPVAAAVPLAVTLDPGLVPVRWTARWAPVVAGAVGDPVTVRAGTGAAVEVAAPVRAGTWGLQVEITFAEGRRAAWYWSVLVEP